MTENPYATDDYWKDRGVAENKERFEEPTDTGENLDPFSPENAPVVNIIMQMRIYDVLMALLTHTDKDAAKALLELHADGTIFGSIPSLNGTFITNLVKEESFPTGDE